MSYEPVAQPRRSIHDNDDDADDVELLEIVNLDDNTVYDEDYENGDDDDDDTTTSTTTTTTTTATTALPRKPLSALGLLLFSNSFNVTCLFAFTVFMVEDFNMTDDRRKIGYYAGAIGSAFMLGRILTSILWGRCADKHGRKPVFYIGLVSLAITSIAFGMSPNFYFAVSMRFLSGLFNALVAVAKATAPELVPPSMQATSMSLISGAYACGLLVGPAMGGILAGRKHHTNSSVITPPPPPPPPPPPSPPATGSNVTMLLIATAAETTSGGNEQHLSLFEEYPYLLPMLVNSIISMLALVVVMVWLPETSGKRRIHTTTTSTSAASSTASDNNDATMPRYWWCERPVVMSITVYCLISFIDMSLNEVYPLFSATSREHHGLGFNSSDIGVSLAVLGTILIIFTVFIFPHIERRLGLIATFRAGLMIQVPLVLLLPLTAVFSDTRALLWPSLLFTLSIRSMAQSMTFTSSFVLINNSVPSYARGRVNGLAMTVASIAKAMGPAFGGSAYAWSMTNNLPYPLGGTHFVFIMCTIGLVVCVLLTSRLPVSLDSPHVAATSTTNSA